MSRNGSGVYTAPASSFPAVANTLIESTKFNNIITDLAAALTGSIAADGQTTVTADLPMNTHKFTGLAAGSASGHSVEYDQMNTAIGVKRAQLLQVSASVATNALTAQLDPCVLDFRSATLGSGTVNARSVPAAITVTVPSGATLGTVNAIANRLILLAIDNAGAVELAVVNLAGGNNLDEATLISTTAITAGAASANVIYSTTARSNVPFRVVGFVASTQATAGTWATAPSTIQGAGGNALSAMSSLGYGQTWQNLTASRAAGTNYYNTTGKPIVVSIQAVSSAGVGSITLTTSINGIAQPAVLEYVGGAGYSAKDTFIVPHGAYYSTSIAGSIGGTLNSWFELR